MFWRNKLAKDSQEKILSLDEEKFLQKSGLIPGEDLEIFNVKILHNEEFHYIHTLKCGNSGPALVLIHGYGGSSVTFYRLLKELSENFIVFCIDLLGMGLSSRPKFTANNTEETIDYFLNSIEEWRINIKLPHFHLLGHSLGGYISCCYALKYSEIVDSLILLSPAGITYRSEEEYETKLGQIYKRAPIGKKIYLKLFLYALSKRATPQSVYQKSTKIGEFLLKRLISKRMDLDQDTFVLFHKYYAGLMSLPPGSEEAVHHLIRMPLAQAIKPLEHFLMKDLKIKVKFLFGDRDWMDKLGASRLSRQNENRFSYHTISSAGHHVNMDNPQECITHITHFVKEVEENKNEMPLTL